MTIFVRRVFAIEIGQLNAKQSNITISKTLAVESVRKVDNKDILLNKIRLKELSNRTKNE